MADRETAMLKETDRRIIEEVFRVTVVADRAEEWPEKRPFATWQEQLGIYILETELPGDGSARPATWEPFSPSRDMGLALQALRALVRRGWRYDLRVTSARAVLYLFDGSRELEGVAPLRAGNLSAALAAAISRGVARALEAGATHAPGGGAGPVVPAALPAPAPAS